MKHTSGKWRIAKREGHSDGVRPVIYTQNVNRIAIISYRGVPSIAEADANAERICLCVNNFDELVEALESAIGEIETEGLEIDYYQQILEKVRGEK